ncbi:MAG: hypothetical protein IKM27_05595 [Clostridia bacterium]|nr:hypothetical protein [Clostridia bacterium]
MKRSLRIVSVIALMAILVLSCTVAVAYAADEISDVAEESAAATENAAAVAGAIPDEAPTLPEAGIVADEETVITATDHLYKQEKLLLVTAENLADTVYSVDLTVTYYGETGEVIGTETQSYDQLEKGFPKNFIFRPGYDFADYLLTMEKVAFEGETWRNDLIGEFGFSWWSPWDENDNWCGRPHMELKNRSEITRIMKDVSTVIFDENGEVYMVLDRQCECWIGTGMVSNYKHYAENVYVTGDMIHYEDSTWVQPASGGIRPAPKFTYFTAFGVIKPEESETYEFVVQNGYYTPGE